MDQFERYDALDVESVVRNGAAESEDMNAADAAFYHGYLELGEV